MENRRRERLVILPGMIAQITIEKEFFARKTGSEFQQSARFAEDLEIGIRCMARSGSLLPFICAADREDEHFISAALLYIHAVKEMSKENLVRDAWRTRLTQCETAFPAAS